MATTVFAAGIEPLRRPGIRERVSASRAEIILDTMLEPSRWAIATGCACVVGSTATWLAVFYLNALLAAARAGGDRPPVGHVDGVTALVVGAAASIILMMEIHRSIARLTPPQRIAFQGSEVVASDGTNTKTFPMHFLAVEVCEPRARSRGADRRFVRIIAEGDSFDLQPPGATVHEADEVAARIRFLATHEWRLAGPYREGDAA